MAREFSRTNRISEVMMRELALLIQHDLADPRVSMVTVSHVDVTSDLKYARIYVTRLSGFDSEEAAKECLAGLNNAAGFLRRALAKRVKLRIMPELQFRYDTTLEHGFYMDELISKANADIKDEQDPDPETDKD
ncbi:MULTISPECIES: 30S ribosome-binding factor RbfA [Gammaproteobacteria]|jgi:ribosome-binding factor A|uniref:Ribosome-binding factor A n=2 Tax=Gammaproteobacteria TaxID=1236 RepID=A0A2T4CT91_9GAMM|nr:MULTISPECIES: 30S ribosome-binding factor RbfA [Gammaproteobacteria]PTB84783.1 30S ribosome-binding factor RbfA [Pseudidiomarina aestuarii]AFI84132.1 ribosome-binding factor A [Methylophaga nitratireducenticrescens]AUZ84213.1 ribosome-binding factor A [Methylophaga nitratireducenticrescens]MAP27216.1 30S ribosome-binding factor RbfA [Methylophaga sp.]MBP23821.1 30S ribosome-binding factor RbfA [Methylophaga sp.]|tara:strand:- start:1785 stop:2186 length:402 start_codon:yes stop_codon:yes gene_type:complete